MADFRSVERVAAVLRARGMLQGVTLEIDYAAGAVRFWRDSVVVGEVLHSAIAGIAVDDEVGAFVERALALEGPHTALLRAVATAETSARQTCKTAEAAARREAIAQREQWVAEHGQRAFAIRAKCGTWFKLHNVRDRMFVWQEARAGRTAFSKGPRYARVLLETLDLEPRRFAEVDVHVPLFVSDAERRGAVDAVSLDGCYTFAGLRSALEREIRDELDLCSVDVEAEAARRYRRDVHAARDAREANFIRRWYYDLGCPMDIAQQVVDSRGFIRESPLLPAEQIEFDPVPPNAEELAEIRRRVLAHARVDGHLR